MSGPLNGHLVGLEIREADDNARLDYNPNNNSQIINSSDHKPILYLLNPFCKE